MGRCAEGLLAGTLNGQGATFPGSSRPRHTRSGQARHCLVSRSRAGRYSQSARPRGMAGRSGSRNRQQLHARSAQGSRGITSSDTRGRGADCKGLKGAGVVVTQLTDGERARLRRPRDPCSIAGRRKSAARLVRVRSRQSLPRSHRAHSGPVLELADDAPESNRRVAGLRWPAHRHDQNAVVVGRHDFLVAVARDHRAFPLDDGQRLLLRPQE